MTMDETTTPTWLAALTTGDAVILETGRRSNEADCVVRVIRTTPSQVITTTPYRACGDQRFRKDDGYAVEKPYDSWSGRARIAEATPERVAAVEEAVRRAKIIERVRRTEWQQQSTAALEAVAVALGVTP